MERIEANGTVFNAVVRVRSKFDRDITVIDTSDVRMPCVLMRSMSRHPYMYLDFTEKNLSPDCWRVWIPYGSMITLPEENEVELDYHCWIMSSDDIGLALLRIETGHMIVEERRHYRRDDWGSRFNNMRGSAGEG